MKRCRDCGRLAVPTFAVDGTGAAMCEPCVGLAIAISDRHSWTRRIHLAGHGWEPEQCPVCWEESEAKAREGTA